MNLVRQYSGKAKSAMRKMGYRPQHRPFSEFISFKETLKAAKAAGVSVSQYIERRHMTGPHSALDQTIDGMTNLGVFAGHIDHVCEVGPGSGRYLERIKELCRPAEYEIYETSSEWRQWLIERYGVIARSCNGRTLGSTASGSVDLVQAHKVFPGLPFLVSTSYFSEMARVVRPGGWVVFDVMTEACFAPAYRQQWFDVNPWEWDWSPHLISRDYASGVMSESGVDLVGSFLVPLHPAVTECLVFRKREDATLA